MFDVVDRLLALAAERGADEAEVFAEQGASTRIKVFGQKVEELTAARRRGIGLRVVTGRAVGYGYASELGDEALAGIADRAVDNARVADADEFVGLPEPAAAEPLDIHDPRLSQATESDKIRLALAVERAALAADPRVKVVEDTVVADGEVEVFLASSRGARGTYRENSCYAFAYALAEQDGRVETGLSFAAGRALEQLDAEAVGQEAAQRACALLGSVKAPSLKGAVVLDPFVAASVLGVLSSALTAEAVQKGRSLFADLVGSEVAAPSVTLVDDGRRADGLASAPFDGEGVPCRRTPLIEAGVLRGFLHNTYTARKAGAASTGNGVRGGYATMPSVGPTNLVLEGPTTPVADMIAAIEHGVLVTNAVGVHSGANPITGQFSVGINGVLIESGRLASPVREMTLAGDIVSMLKGIAALGDDARWSPSGSIKTPSVTIEGMTIGGA